MTRRRSLLFVTTALALLSGCTSSGQPVPPAAAAIDPIVWVVLGGDPTLGRGVDVADTWPQVIFSEHVPPQTVHVDLGISGADVLDVQRSQVDAALALDADVALLWLGDDDAALADELLSGALEGSASRLTDAGSAVVVVLGGQAAVARRSLVDAALPSGVIVVEIPEPGLSDVAGLRAIADQLGPVLATSLE